MLLKSIHPDTVLKNGPGIGLGPAVQKEKHSPQGRKEDKAVIFRTHSVRHANRRLMKRMRSFIERNKSERGLSAHWSC